MTKRTAKETWDALEEAGLDAEIESVLAMTPEERERDLKEAGFDLDEVRARSDAFFEKLQAMPTATAAETVPAPVPATPNVVPLTPRARRFRAAAFIGAGLALAASVALVVRLATPPPPVGAASPLTPAERAFVIRDEATEECRQEHWKECLDRLDMARALDPDGDAVPEVQELRKVAGGKMRGP